MIKIWHITGKTTNNMSPIRAVCGVALWSLPNLLPVAVASSSSSGGPREEDKKGEMRTMPPPPTQCPI